MRAAVPTLSRGIGVAGALVLLFAAPADAKTIVRVTGQCTREVVIQIEIFTRPIEVTWGDALQGMLPFQRDNMEEAVSSRTSLGPGALAEIAAQWKQEIESVWNGPTDEQIKATARELGKTSAQVEQATSHDAYAAERAQLDAAARARLKALGASGNCAEVNCCKIYFKADVKVRAAGAAPDPNYHQVEVMNHEYRSFVRAFPTLHSNHSGTSGCWGYHPHRKWDASAAHETGHLMGLDDQYIEGGGHQEGHEHDVMNNSLGWPMEAGIQEILSINGAECDCCPKAALDHYAAFNLAYAQSQSALVAKSCPALQRAEQDLLAQLSTVQGAPIPLTDKMNLTAAINAQLAAVQAALKDCNRRTATQVRNDMAVFVLMSTPQVATDSTTWCTYGGGTQTRPPGGDDPRDGPPPTTTPSPSPSPSPAPSPSPSPSPSPTPGSTPSPPPSGGDPKDVPVPTGGDPRDKDVPKPPAPPGDDPRDKPTDGDPRDKEPGDDPRDEPRTPEMSTFIVKAKTSLLRTPTGTTTGGEPVAGQQVKLFAPSTDVPLPTADGSGPRRDEDFSKDPIQCTTDASGTCSLDVPAAEMNQPTGSPGGRELPVTADANKGITVETPAGSDPPSTSNGGVPEGAKVEGSFTLGEKTYYRMGFGIDAFDRFKLKGTYSLPWQEDYCRDKQPGLPDGSVPLTEAPGAGALRGERLSLPPAREDVR